MILDSAAIKKALGTKGFNGYFGCTKCTSSGQVIGRTVRWPPQQHDLRTDEEALADARNLRGGFIRFSPFNSIISPNRTVCEWLHIFSLGLAKDIFRDVFNPIERSRTGIALKRGSNDIVDEVVRSAVYPTNYKGELYGPRSYAKMKGNDVDEVIFVLIPALIFNGRLGGVKESTILLFGISIFRRMLLPRMTKNVTHIISEQLEVFEELCLQYFGPQSFTFKMHQATAHLRHEILNTCSPIDVSTSGFEACNKIIKDFGSHCQRSFAKEAVYRTLLLKELKFLLKDSNFFASMSTSIDEEFENGAIKTVRSGRIDAKDVEEYMNEIKRWFPNQEIVLQ